MKESYGEGIASHTGPEPCVGTREGVGEASAGARAGGVLSRESARSGVPTVWFYPEGNTGRLDIARGGWTPRGRRPLACTETPGRDLGCPAAGRDAAVRLVNPKGARQG
jgi:hypothetical protein